MGKKQIAFRLTAEQKEKLSVLSKGQSQEAWLCAQIEAGAERQARMNVLAMQSFREAASAAVNDAEGSFEATEAAAFRQRAQEYEALIRQYEGENDILRKPASGG